MTPGRASRVHRFEERLLEELIRQYGYGAVLVGTFLEGETILILGGFAAHRGYLTLPGVIAAAFVGSLAGDQLAFLLGRRKGRDFVAARPRLEARLSRVQFMLERHEVAVLLSFRFLYGLRNAIPIAVGLGRTSAARFAFFNLIGALVWSVTLGVGGYLFGTGLERFIDDIKRYEVRIAIAIIVAGVLFYGVRLGLRRRMRRNSPS